MAAETDNTSWAHSDERNKKTKKVKMGSNHELRFPFRQTFVGLKGSVEPRVRNGKRAKAQ